MNGKCTILLQFKADGGYSQWGNWSLCSVSCGKGRRIRYRTCTSPPPSTGGKGCFQLGPHRETKKCFAGRCPGMNIGTNMVIVQAAVGFSNNKSACCFTNLIEGCKIRITASKASACWSHACSLFPQTPFFTPYTFHAFHFIHSVLSTISISHPLHL